jgi:hypothetical protein
MYFLSEQEIVQLKNHHKKEWDKGVCNRIKAILLYDDGGQSKDIVNVY